MTECIVRDSKIINRQFFFSRKTVFILRCLTIKLELAYCFFFFSVQFAIDHGLPLATSVLRAPKVRELL